MFISKLFLIAAIFSLTSAGVSAEPNPTQTGPQQDAYQGNYGSRGQTITCSSDDGDRHHCDADTRGGVRFNRQISGSQCEQGKSWGYDDRGIWVDHGCRAEFIVGGSGSRNGNDNRDNGYGQRFPRQSAQTITCSSDNGKRNYCAIGQVTDTNDVVLTQQLSGSECRRGQDWGVDRDRGLWVDHGCRAEFTVGGGNRWQGQQQSSQSQIITCSSDDGDKHYCSTSGIDPNSIVMARQISGSECRREYSWGVDRRGLWVDKGCRAEFSAGGGNRWQGQQSSQSQIVTCSSDDGDKHYCSTSGIDPNSIVMTRQISGSECRRDYSWGVDRRGLWVDKGCRAEFQANR